MKGDHFLRCSRFVVGYGSLIRFWHDNWCGDQPLKLMFPLLFEIVADNNASRESLLERQLEGWSRNWHVEFIRKFNDWEIDEVASFFHLLDSHTPLGEGNDRMI